LGPSALWDTASQMLPTLHAPTVAGHAVPWFALLVGLAVLVGLQLVRWRAPRCGVEPRHLDTLLPTIMASSACTRCEVMKPAARGCSPAAGR
jgi:hypothetical protein